jgi:hypothetical protein
MTWQEELRQLDSALAGGELSANEYRKRRDEILAAASSAQPPSPVIGPPTGPRPVVTPPPPDAPDAAEVTQVVNVESGESAGEVTQIITNPIKGNNGAQATPAPPDEATSPAIPQPQWASLPPTHNAQTTVASFPPVPPPPPPPPPPPQVTGPAVTPLDAQDLFTSNKQPAGSRKPMLAGLAVLVVLAVAGAAVWFFVFSGDDTPDSAADTDRTSEQPTTQALPEPVDITNIDLPGELAENSGEMDITRASELAVIAPSEATLLADAGAQELTYLGHSDGNYRFLLYAYKSDSAEAAKALAGDIGGVQQQLGFTETKVDGVPDTVAVTTVSNSEAVALRGVYTYGDTTIQLSVLQIPVGDLAEMHAQFQTAMTTVTDAAPPTK